MTYANNDPRREAERLRILMEGFRHAMPSMTLDEAVPMIFAAEKRTAELEAPKTPAYGEFTLPDSKPETIGKFIDLRVDIQELINDRNLILAIKEVRATTGLGLKESKDGVEHWRMRHVATPTPVRPAIPYPPSRGTGIDRIADWIAEPAQKDIQTMVLHPTPSAGRIHAIKEVRSRCPLFPGLKEAKDGCEEWLRRVM